MKVTSRDIAALVRETKQDRVRQSKPKPEASLVDALVKDELAALTSLVDAVPTAVAGENTGSTELVDTAAWAADLGIGE